MVDQFLGVGLLSFVGTEIQSLYIHLDRTSKYVFINHVIYV